jgi:transposase
VFVAQTHDSINSLPKSSKAMTPEQQEIQSLKKQLWRSQRDNEILKKATALFAVDNQNTLGNKGLVVSLFVQ